MPDNNKPWDFPVQSTRAKPKRLGYSTPYFSKHRTGIVRDYLWQGFGNTSVVHVKDRWTGARLFWLKVYKGGTSE